MPLFLFILTLLLSAAVAVGAQEPPTFRVEVATDLNPVLHSYFRDDSSRMADLWSTQVQLNRVHYTDYIPFFPVLYFEPASGRIPPLYRQFRNPAERVGFHQSATVIEGIEQESAFRQKQRDVLNIIGEQMVFDPEMTITLEGGWSNEPGESPELATKRVEAVRDYLQDVWEISASRIRSVAPRRPVPDLPHVRARKEARSVRIVFDDGYHHHPPMQIRTKITRSPGYQLMALRFQLDAGVVHETTRAELVIVSGADTLCRFEIPIGMHGHPIDSMALWSLPRDVRHLDSALKMQVIVGEGDGTERLSNVVTIDLVVGDEGEHPDVDRSLTPDRRESGRYAIPMRPWDPDGAFAAWLGPNRSSMETERLTVTNFAFGDSALPFEQEEAYAAFVDKIARKVREHPKRRWRMKITAAGDLTEPDFTDPKLIDDLDSILERTRQHAEGARFDSAFRTGLCFFEDDGDFEWGMWRYVFREIVYGRDVGLRGFGLDSHGRSGAIRSDVENVRRTWVNDIRIVRPLRAEAMLHRLRRDLPDIEFDTVRIESAGPYSGSSFHGPLMPIEHNGEDRSVRIEIYSDTTRKWFEEEREKE